MLSGGLFMKKNTLQRFLLTLSVVPFGGVFFSAPALAGVCQPFSGGSCPTVQSVQANANGSSASVNWAADGNAQTYASLNGSRATTWGLYLLYGWTANMNGHWFSGGTMQPILTVSNTDPARRADGTSGSDSCTSDPYYCTHETMAARFYQKYGFMGTTNVNLPSPLPVVGRPCMIFGGISPINQAFHTVFAPGLAQPCEPGFPGTVDPGPDPQWCGMSTSALNFEFGDMAPASVSGQSLSKTAVMACSEAGISYNLYLSNVSTTGRNRVDMGRGVTATVSANNQALQTNRTSTGATNSLTITVTLSGTPTSTGAISGTGILAVNYF
ncbi:Uncharacterised protein [Raoultella terrigena]|uniref:hypothetical protein n=1 Tax=Raoultella terrigena TaxID=577 RepID=UPI000E031BD5|nr:hypothetical protein [Raoultella terrigena]SUQ56329.1 Uncharacterised protein [Raoultella terrigena]